jgi:hypothetical protein
VDSYSTNEFALETLKIAKDEVELVYAKSNFCIHPTSNDDEKINGFVTIARNVSVIFKLKVAIDKSFNEQATY